MFAIGASLREARVRQRLGFPEIEHATKIRVKHLKALEDEQFELLPGQTYVKGFLRTYAEYLGLDGQLYVDEFNSRYAIGEEEPAPIARRNVGGRRRHRLESRLVLFVLAGIAAVTALAIVAWKSGGDTTTRRPPLPDAKTSAAPQPPTPPAKKKRQKAEPKPKPPALARVVLVASQGASWIEAHAGSQTGRQLYEGTLEPGQTLPLPKLRRVWLNVGQPASLTWKVNGVVRPTPGTETAVFVVTAKAITQATPPA